MKGLTPEEVDLSGFGGDDGDQRQPQSNGGFGPTRGNGFGGGLDLNYIYMQEHLTKRNKDLLKAARFALKDSYEYPGYVLNGEIRVKFSESDKYIVIRSEADIEKLKRNLHAERK